VPGGVHVHGHGGRLIVAGPDGYDGLNVYSRIIVDEALRRGIGVEILDPEVGELVLSCDGRRVTTIQSLSDLTSAVAFRRCDHKGYTRRILERAGLRVPPGRAASFDEEDLRFLDKWGELVVKPARGEGGRGVSVGVVDSDGLAAACDDARAVCPEVLLEQRCHGEDLRVVVIGDEVVAASVRRPPTVVGDGRRSVRELIESLDSEFPVPVDATTAAVVEAEGCAVNDVLPDGETLAVRRTANLHTGGTIRDVTDDLHPALAEVALRAAAAIEIPVLGLDLIVPSVTGPDYTIIEANEQPGLANHEPRPTAQRFLDLLFPG
jgi:GNAT-family acetyltransferase (TIGR03103 family)